LPAIEVIEHCQFDWVAQLRTWASLSAAGRFAETSGMIAFTLS